ncbi:hypothetical protein [Lacisediminimonas sp.]|uniref:hypothetical protein n=1 Tax=Lacisediminimonas sp. TaxID=3060582 RepID=UPI0027222FDD|nr:hypothetical protein [Lacisediminimonas sp.]MDO8299020.1 hypothetical protein [Lacisediminimonas sp.]MDO9216343.1 hypothetical protein [Lacisediminimonas sp.]
MHRFSRLNRQCILTSVLTLALLFVQSLGLLHAVAHAGNAPASHGLQIVQLAPADSSPADTSLFDGKHSCASFEAATLGAAVHVKAFIALLPINASLPAGRPLPVSRDAVTRYHFESRAPPSRLS